MHDCDRAAVHCWLCRPHLSAGGWQGGRVAGPRLQQHISCGATAQLQWCLCSVSRALQQRGGTRVTGCNCKQQQQGGRQLLVLSWRAITSTEQQVPRLVVVESPPPSCQHRLGCRGHLLACLQQSRTSRCTSYRSLGRTSTMLWPHDPGLALVLGSRLFPCVPSHVLHLPSCTSTLHIDTDSFATKSSSRACIVQPCTILLLWTAEFTGRG